MGSRVQRVFATGRVALARRKHPSLRMNQPATGCSIAVSPLKSTVLSSLLVHDLIAVCEMFGQGVNTDANRVCVIGIIRGTV